MMTKADLEKFEIVKALWKIVKLADNNDIAAADIPKASRTAERPKNTSKRLRRISGITSACMLDWPLKR